MTRHFAAERGTTACYGTLSVRRSVPLLGCVGEGLDNEKEVAFVNLLA